MRVPALSEAKSQSRRRLPWQGQTMQGKAHPACAQAAPSSPLASLGWHLFGVLDRRLPKVSDDVILTLAVTSSLLLIALDVVGALPGWSVWAYTGALLAVSFTLLTRNTLCLIRAEKTQKRECDHAYERDER